MATVAASPVERQSAERKFYSRMALFMIALVFIGFAPSFYLRGYVNVPRPNPSLPPSVMAHGLLFSLWMLVFVAQTQLVAAGRRDLHMRLGKLSFVLALAILPLMYLVGVWQVARANSPPYTDPLNWSVVPLSAIPAYGIMLWVGWNRRREAQVHKRAMLSAALMLLHPAIGRIPMPPMLATFALTGALSVATFIPLLVWDKRRLGHIHWVSRLGVSLAAATLLISLAFLATGTWAPIARLLPGVGG
jgi:cytochrome bd-type quinol oxidase subunit 2